MAEKFSNDLKEDRLKISEFRASSIKHVMTLALAAMVIPLFIPEFFDTAKSPLDQTFWRLAAMGWAALSLSLGAGAIFLLRVPQWIKDRDTKELWADNDSLVGAYGLTAIFLFIGVAFLFIAVASVVLS